MQTSFDPLIMCMCDSLWIKCSKYDKLYRDDVKGKITVEYLAISFAVKIL